MNTPQTITRITVVTSILLFNLSLLSAQYTYPDNSEMFLLAKSESLMRCKLFRNDMCNVFLFTPDNVICSLAGNLDSLPYVARMSDAGKCETAFFIDEKLIVQRENEIVLLSQDLNSISKSVNEVKLYTCWKRSIKVFSSNSDGFFIVEYKLNKKINETTSVLSYFNLKNGKTEPFLEAKGIINCVSGDTAALCLGLDSNLVLVAHGQSAIISVEKEDITAVAPSSAGIFYGTNSSVNFIDDDLQIIGIAKQGALQLIDNCNTLYMILTDGSLIRVHNTMAFAGFYNHLKQSNNENTHPDH